jgi:hypothetical protein
VIVGVILALLVLPVIAAIIRSRRPRRPSRPHLAASSVVAASQARAPRVEPLPPGLDDYLMSALRATGTRLPSEPSVRVARGTSPPPAERPVMRFDTEPPPAEAPNVAVRFSRTPGLRPPTTLAPEQLPPVDDTDPYADPFDDDPPTLVTLRPFD